jgi:hypothetical protein
VPGGAGLERKRPLVPAALLFALHWAPVWAPLVLCSQIVGRGLLPARAESQRLDEAENSVLSRVSALTAEERELADEQRMLADEIYQERVRRSLIDAKGEPLTLARARARER